MVEGKLIRVEQFPSRYITPRNIDIWLPASYSNGREHAVMYMHDGQMLYDPKQTWNKQAWNIDETISALYKEGNIKECIVVGVWNGDTTRHADYFPQKPYESLDVDAKEKVSAMLRNAGRIHGDFQPLSDAYLSFLVEELKPYIDSCYRVARSPENTFLCGSSMGGLISIYGLCEYPDVFGGAACLSTHWVGSFSMANNPIPEAFYAYIEEKLPPPLHHKIYFDCGDQTLDSLYPPLQAQVDRIIASKGYTDKYAQTHFFPNHNHSEEAWASRLHIPMQFKTVARQKS